MVERNNFLFFLNYTFFVSLFVMIFTGDDKYKLWLKLIGVVLFIDLFLGVLESLILDIGVGLIGWLAAQGILCIKKLIKR